MRKTFQMKIKMMNKNRYQMKISKKEGGKYMGKKLKKGKLQAHPENLKQLKINSTNTS